MKLPTKAQPGRTFPPLLEAKLGEARLAKALSLVSGEHTKSDAAHRDGLVEHELAVAPRPRRSQP